MTPKAANKERKRLHRELETVDADESLTDKQKTRRKRAIARELDNLESAPATETKEPPAKKSRKQA